MQHASSEPEEIGWVPREILDRPVSLRDGVGPVHEKVTTSSLEAQKFYDHGLAYLHSYVWLEAARTFHQALRLDPKMAMAYVGLSRTYSGLTDRKAALEALRKAQARWLRRWERHRIRLRAQQLEAIDDIDNKAKLEAWPEFLLERGRPQETLLAAQKLTAGRWPVGRTMGHILAGRAFVHLNQLDRADGELAAAEEEAAQIEEVNPEPLLPHPRI